VAEGRVRGSRSFAKPKSRILTRPIFSDENVFPLKVAVNDSLAVCCRQTTRDLDGGDVRSSVMGSRGAVSPSLEAEVGIGRF